MDAINLTALQRFDPNIQALLESACQVAVYAFNLSNNQWEKTDAEGALFICSRNTTPLYSMVIPNRLNRQNFTESITIDLEVAENNQYLLYRKGSEYIRAVWFFNKDDCAKISSLIIKLSESLKQSGKTESSNKTACDSDIVSLLNRAQLKYDMKSGNQGQQHAFLTNQPPPPIVKPVPIAISSLMQAASALNHGGGGAGGGAPFVQLPTGADPSSSSTNQNRPPNTSAVVAAKTLVGATDRSGHVTAASAAPPTGGNSGATTTVTGVPNLLQRLMAASKIAEGGVTSAITDGPAAPFPPNLATLPPHLINSAHNPVSAPPTLDLKLAPSPTSAAASYPSIVPPVINGAVFLQTPKSRITPDQSSTFPDQINQSVLLTPAALGSTMMNDLQQQTSLISNNDAMVNSSHAVNSSNANYAAAVNENKQPPSVSSNFFPLMNENAFITAFTNLMRSDKIFCMKLHQEYMRSLDHYLANSSSNQ